MVMYRDKHPIIWTGVYADIEVSLKLIRNRTRKGQMNHRFFYFNLLG